MSRKSRDMGHPRLGGFSTKEKVVRDLGHPLVAAKVKGPGHPSVLLFVGTDIDIGALHTRIAGKIQGSHHFGPEIDAGIDRRRIRLYVEIGCRAVQEQRIRIARVRIVSRRCQVR